MDLVYLLHPIVLGREIEADLDVFGALFLNIACSDDARIREINYLIVSHGRPRARPWPRSWDQVIRVCPIEPVTILPLYASTAGVQGASVKVSRRRISASFLVGVAIARTYTPTTGDPGSEGR